MAKKKASTARDLRGQLMLQIAAGRFFAPGVELNEWECSFTVYSNASFVTVTRVPLPVGTVIPSTEMGSVCSAMITVVDRLETYRPDGAKDFLISTGGTDLVDDIAYVLTFVLNCTVSRNYDQTRRLVGGDGQRRGGSAGDLFPGLFGPALAVRQQDWDDVRRFMDELLALHRDDFARAMRAIRGSVDATRRAVDDPTGAYTDLVAALESLAEDDLTTPTTWDRYDGHKRKLIDESLKDAAPELAQRVREAILEADRAGLKRRFVSSTLSRLDAGYFREGASGARRPPRRADLERLLSVAYDIRSRRTHVLQDMGEGVWLFNDGAETAYEPTTDSILTLAGLWRITRHVVRRYVADATKVPPEPWDYRPALPGLVDAQLAPQYWVHNPDNLSPDTTAATLDGLAEALIGWLAGAHDDGLPPDPVCRRIESLVPTLTDGDARTDLVAIHALWNSWVRPEERRPEAIDFLQAHGACLRRPSASAAVVLLLADPSLPAGLCRDLSAWSDDEWVELASHRHEERRRGRHARLPAKIDALIQLEAADRLEAAGRHDEAVRFAARAVEEVPGDEKVMQWERRLQNGDHDPNFSCSEFLIGEPSDDSQQKDSQPPHAEAEPEDYT
ncbi:hypothetical protein [Arsenicicoccus bolidensis]|uniref:hypothetical protein n=1 Tax=Arsenicicoccus bolidensis TaxID=229480 RepID=UPI0028B1C901|nr:hypothetical protein [Arsenicicoccus bolidensis]